ncbi:MAG: hypothetical protein K0R36_834 [Chryseobacterium sp.]|nr:hypothetical protein [Chryseobacterium sp.]
MKRNFALLLFFLCMYVHSQRREEFDKLYVKTYLETSQKDFNKAIKIADSLYQFSSDPILKGRSLMLSATLYQQKGKFTKAVDYALSAEKVIDKTDNITWKTRIYGFLASQYRMLKLYDLSKKYADEAIESSKKITDTLASRQMVGLMMQEKAYFEIDRKNYKASIRYVKSSENLLKAVNKNHDFFTANNEQLLGLNYFHLQQYPLSLKHYEAALSQVKDQPETFLTGLIYNGISNVYLNTGRLKEAEYELNKARKIADETQFLQLKKEIYDTAERLYLAKKEINKVGEFKKKQDSVKAQLDIETGSFYNSSLKAAETKNTSAKKSGIIKNILIISVLAVLLGFFIYFLYYQRAEKMTYRRFKAIIAELNRRAHDREKQEHKGENHLSGMINEDQTSLMTSLTENKLVKDLEKFEQTDIYLKNDISLSVLASYCKTNTKYLSYVIKHHKGMDFNNYINSLRINYIIEKLTHDPEYRKYKIATLAEECGFSSQNKFATVFKKITTISPSVFIKYLQDQPQNT